MAKQLISYPKRNLNYIFEWRDERKSNQNCLSIFHNSQFFKFFIFTNIFLFFFFLHKCIIKMDVCCAVVHTQAVRGHGRPARRHPRRLGQMGPDEHLQQILRWRIEIRGAGMRQSAARQQREILHRGEEEIDHLQHQCKHSAISLCHDHATFLSSSCSFLSFRIFILLKSW